MDARGLCRKLQVPQTGISLTAGYPGKRHLKDVAEIMESASKHLMESQKSGDVSFLAYGPEQGSQRFRDRLAQFLTDAYHNEVHSKNLFVTAGATNGLLLASTILLPKDTPIFVEDPSYFIAIEVFKTEFEREVIGVQTDDNGINLHDLEEGLKAYCSNCTEKRTDEKPFCGMIYLIPTYNNPRGFCLSPERCHALVVLARKYKVLIICDDVYNLLHYDPSSVAPLRLLGYDNQSDPGYQANVLSNGSFSKILCPGARLGWIEAGDPIIKLLSESNVSWSGGSANHFTSEVVASALELGLVQQYLKKLCLDYRDAVASVLEVLEVNLPQEVRFNRPCGGYFIWIEMPDNVKAMDVVTQCKEEHNVTALVGNACSVTGSCTNCIRIAFAFLPKDILLDGMKKLCQVIAHHVTNKL